MECVTNSQVVIDSSQSKANNNHIGKLRFGSKTQKVKPDIILKDYLT